MKENITRTNKQSNDAYGGITSTMNIAKIRNKDLNPKISEDDKAGNSQASKNPLNTTKAKDYKDANIDGTEDGTEENPNPPSTLGINNSITKTSWAELGQAQPAAGLVKLLLAAFFQLV